MKHTFYHILGILSAFCLMFVLLITSVEAVCYWTPGYFKKQYTKYQVLDSLPEMSMEDLLQVTDEMMDYLKGNREDLHVFTTMGGEYREFFTEREIAHMEDVQELFLSAILIRKLCLLFLLFTIIMIPVTKGRLSQTLPSTIFSGTLSFFAIAALLGIIISTNFSKYFVVFHHIFFDNDLWILDPSVDMLINIVPEGFFRDTAARIIITFGISAILVLAISFLLMRKNKSVQKRRLL
ncbi:MAG: TIGR01906 family membrane protein [Lachnospiraceae bacterium]|nr:TIGR01906 family membrane protein [Lachnospiraceae bacterium]